MVARSTISAQMSRDEILQALEQQEREGVAYWSAFPLDTFFAKIGASWSPAETVRHLTKSTRPVARALSLPRLVLRVMFGRSRRPSQTYDSLLARYHHLLAEGGGAGRFAPSASAENDRDAVMHRFATTNRDLRQAIARWPDPKLDAYQLPHPLLGKLTVREMLFFTLLHQRHHVEIVQRRLREAAS